MSFVFCLCFPTSFPLFDYRPDARLVSHPKLTLRISSRYITHYSYFGAFRSSASNVGPNAAFLTQKGQLTDIGAWYLGEKATGNVPKGGAAQTTRFVGWAAVVLGASIYCLM